MSSARPCRMLDLRSAHTGAAAARLARPRRDLRGDLTMPAPNRYDGNLQMFVEEAGEPDMARLNFLRWLAEHHELEHQIAGPSSGDLTNVQARGTPELCRPA